MTIDWHAGEGENGAPELCYRIAGTKRWERKVAATEGKFLTSERASFRTELTGLKPGTEYVFQVGGYAKQYRFRTMPADSKERPIVFAAGGDTLSFPQLMEQTSRAAMQHDLDFVLWGGDLAYANGAQNPGARSRWESWFEANLNALVTEEGRVIPIIVAVGNHEVVDGYYKNHPDYQQEDSSRTKIAPNFYALFAFPGQPGYGVLDIGDYLSLIVLDTDHTNPIDGVQTAWLKEVLQERKARGVAHVFPVYHFPAYPSHRSFDSDPSARVRTHWVPLFEENGVKFAFENHDHTYKRTHPIRGGAVADDGIVYLGDGAWGVPTREGDQRDAWYIGKFSSSLNALIVTLHGEHRHVKAIDPDGKVLDQYGTLP
jgi:hypothetical protein